MAEDEMPYVLRFVQRFAAKDESAFLALEADFAALEVRKGWPRGRRSRPFAGREPVHTLLWECEFETLAALQQAAATMARDCDHARLLRRQLPFFREAWTEIDEVLELGTRPGADHARRARVARSRRAS